VELPIIIDNKESLNRIDNTSRRSLHLKNRRQATTTTNATMLTTARLQQEQVATQ